LVLLSLLACQAPPEEKQFPFTMARVIADIGTDHENGGIGLAATDYDGDGDIDLIGLRHLDKGKILLYKNDGSGNFSEGDQIGQVPCDFYGIGLGAADFDHDGDIDLVMLKHKDGGQVVLYENDGTGLMK
jgi:hypothetical protein